MNDSYLIPANTKKSSLILGLFEPLDLIIFVTGILLTFLMIMILPVTQTEVIIVAIIPGLIGGFLVLPVAYYHNVRQLIIEIYKYFTRRSRYVWKGWCFFDESEQKSNAKQ